MSEERQFSFSDESDDSGTSKTVSFRVDLRTYKKLWDEAAKTNLSIGTLVKQRALSGEKGSNENSSQITALREIQSQITTLGRCLKPELIEKLQEIASQNEDHRAHSNTDLLEVVREIENQIAAFRTDLMLAVEVILFAAGKLTTEQAHEWVAKKLNGKNV